MATSETIAPQKRSWLLGVLLLLSFLPYANAVVNGFVYDDHTQIERNPYVHSIKYIGKIFDSSLAAEQGKQVLPNYYRPLINFTFLVCYELFGLSPYGFHLISILLNCVVVWLVFEVSAELFSNEWFGLIAAVFFALHPIHTEPVAWIDGVSDIEVSLFCLLAFWLFLRQEHAQGRRGIWVRAGMIASFALALFSKETAMAFPILVTIYEHVYRSDRLATSWTQKLTRYGWFWVTQLTYLSVRAMVLGTLIPTPLRGDFDRRGVLLTALALTGQYAGKLLWPFPLVAFPPFQRIPSFADPRVLFGIAGLLAVGAAFVLLWKRSKLYTFALFWIFVILAPALNVRYMGANVLAERYLYLPSVGFSWLVAGAIWWCWHRPYSWMLQLRWALGATAAIVALLAGHTIVARNRDWKDDRTLVVRTLEVRPDSPNMRNDLGLMKWYDGDHDEAERQWQLALSYKPDTVEVLSNLGFARLEEKRYEEAIPYLQKAIQLKLLFATPHIHLARVYAAEGRNEDAENEFHRAVEIYSLNPDARKAWGDYYFDAGRLSEAEQQFLVSVSVAPDLEAWSALGVIYDRQNATDKAEDAWRHVLSFESFNAQAHLSLGRIYLSKNRFAEAQKEFDACLLMDPANPEALAGRSKIRAVVSPSSPGSATQ